MKTIQDYFKARCEADTDINQHLPVLKEYAEKCSRNTEFGSRGGESTAALLAAKPEVLITYDINPECVVTWKKLNAIKDPGTKFIFRRGDSRREQIEETDLLFIDSYHTCEHLTEEFKHAAKVRKYIILHDTESFGHTGQDGSKGLTHAVHDFLAGNQKWRHLAHYTGCGGLTVLERFANE